MKITKFFALLCAAAFTMVGCTEPDPNNPNVPNVPETKGKLVLSADKTTVSTNETVTMKVEQEGVDVTDQATIYDADMNIVPAEFTPTQSGTYSFFATKGSESSNNLVVTVLATMPDIPADPEPANTKFNHRVVLIDHTGVGCGYCPYMTDNLLALAETEWHQHYTEVTCHAGSFAGGDPANSAAANSLNRYQSKFISGYPTLCLNLETGVIDNYLNTTAFVNSTSKVLEDYVKKNGADVGIALAVDGDSTHIYCAAQIKAAVEKEYKVTAWLLESNIYSPNQSNAQNDTHKIYNFAIRNIAGEYSNANVQGESIGTLAAGATYDCAFDLPIISTKWKYENMDVLVIVTAKDSNNKWDVVNSAICHIGESKAYEYVK